VKETNLQPADEQLKFRGFGNFKPDPFFIKKMYGAERSKTTMISVFKVMTPDLISQIAKSQNGIEIITPQKMPDVSQRNILLNQNGVDD
jgi:hypothetical protein